MPARSTSEATSTRDPTARRRSSTWKDPNLERRATGIAGDQDRSRRRRRNRNLPKHGVPIGVREQFRRRAQSPMARRPILATTGAGIRAGYRVLAQMLRACLEPRYGFSRASAERLLCSASADTRAFAACQGTPKWPSSKRAASRTPFDPDLTRTDSKPS